MRTRASAASLPDQRHADGAALVDLGQRIRSRRRALGLTLRELSDRTGTSVPFLSQVENGVGTPSLTTLFSLARVLGSQAMSAIRRGDAAWALRHSAGPDAAIDYVQTTQELRTTGAPDDLQREPGDWRLPHRFVTTLDQLIANVARLTPDGPNPSSGSATWRDGQPERGR